MVAEARTEKEWRDSVLESVGRADYKHLATAALGILILINPHNKDWSRWRNFCQDEADIAKKLTYLKYFRDVDPKLVCKLIKAGTKIVIDPKGAGLLIDDISSTQADVGKLAIGALLVTIYTASGKSKFRTVIMNLSKFGKDGWSQKMWDAGMTPDSDTVENLGFLFADLPGYIK